MKKIFLISICTISIQSMAQVNIGANTTPNTDAMLEISGNTKGLLLPRVALSSTSSFSPLSAHVAGMTVYNTATAGAGATAVTPGYYYNTGAAWVKIASGNGNAWLTGGNLNGATSTIGTTDNFDFPFITNSIERMRITNAGNVGIGTATPINRLTIYHTSNTDGLIIQNPSGSPGSTANLYMATYSDIVAGTFRSGSRISAIDDGGFSAHLTFSTKVTGADANALNERMRISSVGFVGIGTTTPITKLDLLGIKSINAGMGTGVNNDDPSQAIIPAGFNGASRLNDWPNGWGGGLSTLDICGSGTYFSAYITRSDRGLKQNINSMNDQIASNLLKLRPVTYFMKEQIKEIEGLQYGFIAQEVKELFPSIVTESSDPNGTIGMNYQALIAPTIYVLQKQEAKINKLEVEIERFKSQNDNLQKMIIEIEKLKMQLKSLQEASSK